MNRSTWIIVMTILLIAAGTAVTASHAGAQLALSDQTDRGRTLYVNACAKCHGQQGDGGQAPRLIGSPNGLPEYKTAQGVFDYVSSQMPNDTPGSLKADEYWDIVAYILDANKLLPPDTTLGPENAANVTLKP